MLASASAKVVAVMMVMEREVSWDGGGKREKAKVRMMSKGTMSVCVRLMLVRATRMGRTGIVRRGWAVPRRRVAAESDASAIRTDCTVGSRVTVGGVTWAEDER